MRSDRPSQTGRRQAIGAAALIASGLAVPAKLRAAQGAGIPWDRRRQEIPAITLQATVRCSRMSHRP
jgi:hypothetical protein